MKYLSRGVPESVTTVFAKSSDIVLIERLQRDKIMSELNLAETPWARSCWRTSSAIAE